MVRNLAWRRPRWGAAQLAAQPSLRPLVLPVGVQADAFAPATSSKARRGPQGLKTLSQYPSAGEFACGMRPEPASPPGATARAGQEMARTAWLLARQESSDRGGDISDKGDNTCNACEMVEVASMVAIWLGSTSSVSLSRTTSSSTLQRPARWSLRASATKCCVRLSSASVTPPSAWLVPVRASRARTRRDRRRTQLS